MSDGDATYRVTVWGATTVAVQADSGEQAIAAAYDEVDFGALQPVKGEALYERLVDSES